MPVKCHVTPDSPLNGLMHHFPVLSCPLLIYFVIFCFPLIIASLLVGIYVMDEEQCWHTCCAVRDVFALFLCQNLKGHAEEMHKRIEVSKKRKEVAVDSCENSVNKVIGLSKINLRLGYIMC